MKGILQTWDNADTEWEVWGAFCWVQWGKGLTAGVRMEAEEGMCLI